MESSSQHASRRPGASIAAFFVVTAMVVAAFSLWTIIPLTWVWIGSQLSGTQFPAGGPYMLVLVGIVLSILAIAWLIGRLNRVYIHITGTHQFAPQRLGIYKSMRDAQKPESRLTVVEFVIVASVVLAAIALTIWFFVAAGSPLPAQ